jgi:hypothetical protein
LRTGRSCNSLGGTDRNIKCINLTFAVTDADFQQIVAEIQSRGGEPGGYQCIGIAQYLQFNSGGVFAFGYEHIGRREFAFGLESFTMNVNLVFAAENLGNQYLPAVTAIIAVVVAITVIVIIAMAAVTMVAPVMVFAIVASMVTGGPSRRSQCQRQAAQGDRKNPI